jgi:hypothetical protein
MILSSDELEILEYLKSWKGKSVSMVEICRCAGGRRKFTETPHWAKGLMSRLVDEKLIEVNERGHYSSIIEAAKDSVDENYFPPVEAKPGSEGIVGDDYFPPREPESETQYWVSPAIAAILKSSGKKFGECK